MKNLNVNCTITQGPQGAVGPAGEDGVACRLTIGTVETLETGQPATLRITGTAPDQVLHIGLPRGEKGDTGNTGATGPMGATGPQGIKGDKGDTGDSLTPIKNSFSGYDGKTITYPIPLNSDGTKCNLSAVYLNGILQQQGLDYSVSFFGDNATINFNETLSFEDNVIIEHIKATSSTQAQNSSAIMPTRLSQFENDMGYVTIQAVPLKVSQLENDKGYITSARLPSKVSFFENDMDYVTLKTLMGIIKALKGNANMETKQSIKNNILNNWFYNNKSEHGKIITLPSSPGYSDWGVSGLREGGLAILKPYHYPETRTIEERKWLGEGDPPSVSLRPFEQPEYYADTRQSPNRTPYFSYEPWGGEGWQRDGFYLDSERYHFLISGELNPDSCPIILSPFKGGMAVGLKTQPAWGCLLMCHFDAASGEYVPFTIEELYIYYDIPLETAYMLGYDPIEGGIFEDADFVIKD